MKCYLDGNNWDYVVVFMPNADVIGSLAIGLAVWLVISAGVTLLLAEMAHSVTGTLGQASRDYYARTICITGTSLLLKHSPAFMTFM